MLWNRVTHLNEDADQGAVISTTDEADITTRPPATEQSTLPAPAQEPQPPLVLDQQPAVPVPAYHPKLKIGLALGSGVARGWAHIGVLEVLEAHGIFPHILSGCSIGAVVGGFYAARKLDVLKDFALSLSKRRVMSLLDFHFSGPGLIGGSRLRKLLETNLSELRIERLEKTFSAVSTELSSGHEIWLAKGSLVEALSASYAMPGIFDPVRIGGRWLMDGALVNPIPVTAARAMGADLVICVNLNNEMRTRGTVIQAYNVEGEADEIEAAVTAEALKQENGSWWNLWTRPPAGQKHPAAPGLASVMIDAFNITQDRIARARLAGDPPDVMISPKMAQHGLFEFHRAQEAIELGRAATLRALPDILSALTEASDLVAYAHADSRTSP